MALDPSHLNDWQRCVAAGRHVRSGQTAEALRLLAPVGAEGNWHPAVSYPDVFQALSAAWREAGQPDRRAEAMERTLAYARARDPQNAQMYSLDLAEALCAAGDVNRALDIFAEQISSQPSDPWPYWFMGISLVDAGRPAWAAAALRQGLQLLRSAKGSAELIPQFEDLLKEAEAKLAAAGDRSPLPDRFERLFAVPPEPRSQRPTPTRTGPKPHKAAKVGRNEPCPCGSGKKYKRCCGA